MSRIATKREMYDAYEAGAFGNKLQTWDSPEEFERAAPVGTFTIRYKGAAGGSKFTAFNVRRDDVSRQLREFVELGADRHRFAFNESAPDHCLFWQGEIQEVPGFGLTSRWSTRKCKMRDAMSEPIGVRHYGHGGTQGLLRSTLTPSSLEDIYALIECYPGACIELSVYAIPVGCIRGRNAVVWEVRHY